jgi:hypothetical protein
MSQRRDQGERLQSLRERKARLAIQLKDIQKQIDETERQIQILEAEISSGEDSTYKNAKRRKIWSWVQQILYEESRRGKGERTKNLWERVNRVYPDVGYNTFRSYMTRFKKEKRIYQPTGQTYWRLTKNEQEEAEKKYNRS